MSYSPHTSSEFACEHAGVGCVYPPGTVNLGIQMIDDCLNVGPGSFRLNAVEMGFSYFLLRPFYLPLRESDIS